MAHWRDTARPVRFFTIDARASFPLLLVLLHIRLWTLGIALAVVVVFLVFEHFGLTLPRAIRRVRLFFIGRKRPANVSAKKRSFIDYGGDDK